MSKKKRWLIGISAVLAVAAVAIVVAASSIAKRFDPYIRQQAIQYLSQRFDSEVEVGKLRVEIPRIPFITLLANRGRGVIAEVIGEDILLRHKGRRDVPPMFAMKYFRFQIDLGRIFDPQKKVALVEMRQFTITLPPKGERPNLKAPPDTASAEYEGGVFVERVVITDSKLIILPRNKNRIPLAFALHRVALDSVQASAPLRYQAKLSNPKPPGTIDATGSFGPWNSESPSDTLLSGDYTFSNADLGVFTAIAGTLQSSGTFEGSLSEIDAKGEADVPNFRLKRVGNPLDLHVAYSARVDGTNGNTILQPIHARLNNSEFTTSGAVVKHEGNSRRSIDFEVKMANGEMLDMLRLATRAKPFMAGRIQMTATIKIPPLSGTVSEKLILDGSLSRLLRLSELLGRIVSVGR